MQEYIQAKRRHTVDFQLRMCKMPFNQYCKTKLRDKGYQALGRRDVRLTVQDMKEIFSVRKKGRKQSVPEADGKTGLLYFQICSSPV